VLGQGRGRVAFSAVWMAAAVLIPPLFISLTPLRATDLAYHLRAGEVMLDGGSLLRVDTFTLLAAGRPWLNQQWGAQILLVSAFRGGGWFSLALLRAALLGSSAALVFLACRNAGASRLPAAALTLVGGALFMGGGDLRPQLFGVACFALVLWAMASRGRHPSRILLIFPVTIVWANVHGSFVLAPVTVLIGAIEDSADGRPESRRSWLLAIATLFATAVNPFGPRVWGYVSQLSTDPTIRSVVSEWRRPSLDPADGSIVAVSALLAVTFVAALALVWTSMRRPRWPLLLALGVFVLPAAASIRGIVWWGMAAPVVLSEVIDDRLPIPSRDRTNAVNTVVVAALSGVLLAGLLRFAPYTSREPPPASLLAFAPTEITRELRATLRPSEPFFNAQLWGSWFEYALPNHPVVVDSRIEVIPEGVWADYLAVSSAREGWAQILERWRIRVAALRFDQQGALIQAMREDEDWVESLTEGDGALFVRRGTE